MNLNLFGFLCSLPVYQQNIFQRCQASLPLNTTVKKTFHFKTTFSSLFALAITDKIQMPIYKGLIESDC